MIELPNPWACIPQWRDHALLSVAPVVPMPLSGEILPVERGRRRYVVARDGLYVQARTGALDITLRMAPLQLRHVGELSESIVLPGSELPRELFQEMQLHAIAAHPQEWAALVHWHPSERRYVLTVPEVVEHSCSEITYQTTQLDRDWLVLNIHSHGDSDAYFSHQDNHSDQFGVYFASVLGHCQSERTIRPMTRLVVDGHFFSLDWHPWEDA